MQFPMTLKIGDVTVRIPINNTKTKADRNLGSDYTDREWLEYHINEALGTYDKKQRAFEEAVFW